MGTTCSFPSGSLADGEGSFSFPSGDCLVFEVNSETHVAEAFVRHGHRCVRDDTLVGPSGYGAYYDD